MPSAASSVDDITGTMSCAYSSASRRLMSRIVDKSPTAVRLGKQAFHAMRDMSLRDALEYAQVMVPVMSSTDDAVEGMAAFQDKRKPNFTGH